MKKFSCFLAIAMMFCGVCAFGEDKVGYVDMNEIFVNYYKTLRENYNIELRRQSFQEQITILRDEFQNSVSEYEKLANDANNELLGDKAREEAGRKAMLLEERLRQKQEEYQKTLQEGMRNLETYREETEERIIAELSEQVTRYAEKQGYTHIFEVSGKSLNRLPFLMVYPKNESITEAIIVLVNGGHEKEMEEAKANLKKLEESAK